MTGTTSYDSSYQRTGKQAGPTGPTASNTTAKSPTSSGRYLSGDDDYAARVNGGDGVRNVTMDLS